MRHRAVAATSSPAPVEYEPGLVEESVRQAIENGLPGIPGLKSRRLRLEYRRRLDAIYRMPTGEQREAAFREHFLRFFRELELDTRVPRWLEPFPCLRTDLECVLVRSSQMAGQEGAELWESRERRGQGIPAYLIITLAPWELGRLDEVQARLLPELQLAHDMLDPDFGFRREDLRRATRAESERLGAAYQSLWVLSARARLQARGSSDAVRPWEELEYPEARELLVPPADETLHQQLLRLARRLAQRCSAASDAAAGCPLCRFPTCDWAPEPVLRQLEAAISADAEGWSVPDGCCNQCAERYELLVLCDAAT